ncbi:MAG TPA: T9SS type A sorting domain-containing protein, partial [Bacteroidia bacterium]|nr:T9SS type A sorting domain-containing protein [Bacteroidia bacterium]
DSLLNYVYFPYTHQVIDLSIFGTSSDTEFIAHGSSSPGGSVAYINISSLDPSVFISFGRLDSVYDSTSTSWLVTKVAKPLNMGDPINGPGTVWDNSMLYLSDHSGSFGWLKDVNDWIGSDKYVGLKYSNGSTIAYGWIRVHCMSEDSCYLKEFSSTTLFTEVQETIKSNVLVYPNPAKEKFTVCFDPSSPAEKICVYDIAGNSLFIKELDHSLEEEINLSAQPGGLYVLHVKTKTGILNIKIVKE